MPSSLFFCGSVQALPLLVARIADDPPALSHTRVACQALMAVPLRDQSALDGAKTCREVY